MSCTPTDDPDERALLTVEDAARFLQVNVSWIYQHARSRAIDRLPVIRVGKFLRFDRRDLCAYVAAKRESTRVRPPHP